VGSDQSSYLFAFKGDNKTKSSYENNDPVDRGMVFPYPKPITIKNFNGTGEDSKKLVEHLIFNKSKKEDRAVGVTYYILERPKITQVGQGTTGGIIVWETKGIGTKGGIPVDYIKGYDVYDKSGKKLNNVMIGLPATAGSDQSFESPEIDPTKTGPNDYTVVIVDKYGNSWPEVAQTPEVVTVTIYPENVTLNTGGTQTFTATVMEGGTTTTAVTWSVQEGSAGGTITSGGVYTAPKTAGTYHVVATSQADATKFATATVTVKEELISVSISPENVVLNDGESQTFTATVTGTTNTSVTWSVQEGDSGGTITSGGVYTAPSTLVEGCVGGDYYHVVATSQADPTKSATATVYVNLRCWWEGLLKAIEIKCTATVLVPLHCWWGVKYEMREWGPPLTIDKFIIDSA
jgi:hypothetical protein